MTRGAEKYSANNWQKACSIEEFDRFKSSAYRHFFQYINGEEQEEDHAAAVLFNIAAIEYLKQRLNIDIHGNQWEACPLLTNYEVSNTGQVRRIKDKKIMAKWLNKFGYELVSLSGEERRHYQVHRLVSATFLGVCSLQVNHKDGVKTNNHIDNLEYVTCSENIKHAFDMGLNKPSRSQAIIDYATAQIIRLRVENGEKQNIVAKEYRLSPQTINDIVKFRIWRTE
jgi:hypothetical protein